MATNDTTGRAVQRKEEKPFNRAGKVAKLIVDLTKSLNSHHNMPSWCKFPTDEILKKAGAYRPNEGLGVPEEWDAGNFTGSCLVLVMLDPKNYGVPDGPVLTIFGDPPPWELVQISKKPSKSGKGIDNRRTNIVEGLLNYWQVDPDASVIRNKLKRAWYVVALALSETSNDKDLVGDAARKIFDASDESVDDNAIMRLIESLTTHCRFETCSNTTRAPKERGWLKSGKSWVCPDCVDIGDSPLVLRDVALPRPAPGTLIISDTGIHSVSCPQCDLTQSFLWGESMKKNGWLKRGKYWYCKDHNGDTVPDAVDTMPATSLSSACAAAPADVVADVADTPAVPAAPDDNFFECFSCEGHFRVLRKCWECPKWACKKCSFWCTLCPKIYDRKYNICIECHERHWFLRQRRGSKIWVCRGCDQR